MSEENKAVDFFKPEDFQMNGWPAEVADLCSIIANEKAQAEIEKLKKQNEIMRSFIEERCCIDDCGFDVNSEPIDVLRGCMIAMDIEARETLKKVEELINQGEKDEPRRNDDKRI